jgi:valyl-tRNA synthetase
MQWHPDFMRVRYENWTNGLTGDWLISRQRFFGVPIPVWYPLDENGERVEGGVITAEVASLPVDPTTDVPPGFTESQRGVPGGFEGEKDIFDTWATSSLTPQLAGGWQRDEELWNVVAPFDLRPRARTSSAPGCSPRWSARLETIALRGRMPPSAASSSTRSQEDVEVQGQRGHPRRHPRPARHRRGAVLGASSRLGADAAFDPRTRRR